MSPFVSCIHQVIAWFVVGQLAKKFCIIWKRKFNWLVQGSALSNPKVICLNPVYVVRQESNETGAIFFFLI